MKILISVVILNAFIFSCRDGNKCPINFYLPAQLYPAKLEYNVGDTIIVSSTFHREVLSFDTEGNEVGFFNMFGVEWMPVTAIYRIDIDSGESHSILSECFDFIENPNYNYVEFQSSTGSTSLFGEYNFNIDSFNLSYSIIALKPGVYLHEFGSFAGIGDSQPFEGRCPGDFAVFLEINKGMDNNISLLLESPNSHYNNWTLLNPKTRFYDMGGFAFRVVP